jgi:hypothetical protein
MPQEDTQYAFLSFPRHLDLINVIVNNCENIMDIIQIYVFTPGSLHSTPSIPHQPTRRQLMPNEKIKRLDVDKHKKCKDMKIFCTICCENVKNTEYIRKLPCSHHFHKKCVDRWFISSMNEDQDVTCPLCRKQITSA